MIKNWEKFNESKHDANEIKEFLIQFFELFINKLDDKQIILNGLDEDESIEYDNGYITQLYPHGVNITVDNEEDYDLNYSDLDVFTLQEIKEKIFNLWNSLNTINEK